MSTTTEIATVDVEEISTIMQGAGAVLALNTNLVNKAETGGQQLMDTIEGEGMTKELDAAVNEWQVKAKTALGILNTRRTPITQVMDKMKSFFTELEGKLDPKKANSIYAKLQIKRNEFAAAEAKRAKEEQAKIQLEKDTNAEKISLTAEIATQIKNIYNDKLFTFKKFLSDTYDRLTLQNQVEIEGKIKNTTEKLPLEAWNKIEPTIFARFMKKEDVDALVTEIRDNLYNECFADFGDQMQSKKFEIFDKIPSRINELKAIEKAGAAEKQRLETEAANRKAAEEKRALEEAEAQKKADLKKIDDRKKMANAGNMFDASAQLQQVKENTAKAREGYKLNILGTAGFAAIFMFWFEKEGSGLTVEAFGKKTVDQMVKFAEKYAHKNNEMIDSESLVYEETYKAVVTK